MKDQHAYIVKRTDSGEYITQKGISNWTGGLIDASLMSNTDALHWKKWAEKRDIPAEIIHIKA